MIFTHDTSDAEGRDWTIRVKVLTWGRPAKRYGVPMSERCREEPPVYETIDVTDDSGSHHPDLDAFVEERDEDIWLDIDEQREEAE